jgi:hypothetical protein
MSEKSSDPQHLPVLKKHSCLQTATAWLFDAAAAAKTTHLYTGGDPPDAMVETLAWLICEQKSLWPLAAIAATVAILSESAYCSVGAKLRQRSWNTPGMSL